MSKRTNKQSDRRRVRRILNRISDTLVGTLSRKVYRMCWGDGMTKNNVRPLVRDDHV